MDTDSQILLLIPLLQVSSIATYPDRARDGRACALLEAVAVCGLRGSQGIIRDK